MQNSRCTPDAFSHAAAPERNHLLLMVAFFFLIGCICIPFVSGGAWLWALAGIGAAMIWLLCRSGTRCGIGIAILCFAVGSLHAHAAFELPMPQPGSYEITGYVYGGSTERTDNRISFVLGDIALDDEAVPGKAYCTLHYEETPPELFDGAQVCFMGRAYHPDGKSGEPRWDFRLWMRQQGYYFGVAAYQELTVENTAASAPVKDAAYRVRQVFSAAFERTMGENGRIAMALLFGERGGLTDEEYSAFQDLGVAHVMSVSGLHVSLVGAMLMTFLSRFSLKRRTQLIVLCFFLLDYCALTGFSAAAVRAAVMLICGSLSRLFLRRGDRITTLSAAMLVVLIIDPLSALSAGFILSFGAMLGITLYLQPVQEKLEKWWPQPQVNSQRRSPKALLARLQQHIKSLLAVSITAQLGVLLPTMYYFHQLPLYGVLINLLIVPLVGSVLVPAYLATLLVSLFPFIGTAVGSLSSLLTDLLLWLVQLLARLPYAAVRTASPPIVGCIGLTAAGVFLSRRVPGSLHRRLAAAALTALVALGAGLVQRPAELRYIQLAVGQADAALLLDGEKTIVIDTGADGVAVIDYLLHENRNVDTLLLTHLHLDHIGGVEALLKSGVRVKEICLPVNAENQRLDAECLRIYQFILAQDIPLKRLASGDELRYNKSTIRVVWPERNTVRSGHDANDYPLVLAIDLDDFTVLNASDLTGLYENHAAVPADVLKVAHHGSSDSTYEAFLDHVSPRYALLSVSSGSRSLPGTDTLVRLFERQIEVFRTDECGDITISVENGDLLIAPYKERIN